MELLRDIRWVIVVAGILLVVASTLGGGLEIREIKIPPLDKWSRILSSAAGIAFIVFGFTFPILVPPPAEKKPSENISIGIEVDRPKPGEKLLPSRTVLRGTLTARVPGNYRVDVIGQDDDGDCWFLKSMFLSTSNDGWDTSLTPALGPAWYGRPISVLIVYREQLSTLEPGAQVTCPRTPLALTNFFVLEPP